MKPILIIILLSCFISLSLCNLKDTVNPIDIVARDIQEKEVGKKGSAGILTEFYDKQNIFDKTDIESKTIFNAEILDTNQKNYTIDCRLWKAVDINLVIFCNFDENIPQGEYSINLNALKSLIIRIIFYRTNCINSVFTRFYFIQKFISFSIINKN